MYLNSIEVERWLYSCIYNRLYRLSRSVHDFEKKVTKTKKFICIYARERWLGFLPILTMMKYALMATKQKQVGQNDEKCCDFFFEVFKSWDLV